MKVTERKGDRRRELSKRHIEWAKSLAIDDGPYPSPHELWFLPKMISVVEEDNAQVEIDQERFDQVVLPIMQECKISRREAMVKALRSALPSSTDTAEDSAAEDDSEAILYRATSLFRYHHADGRTFGSLLGPAGQVVCFQELLGVLRNAYVHGVSTNKPSTHYNPDINMVETAWVILKAVGLPENTRYEEVNKKIICLCYRGGFSQPATFSELVCHALPSY